MKRVLFIIISVFFFLIPLQAEKWHWEHDGEWRDKFYDLAASAKRKNNFESEMNVLGSIAEKEEHMKTAEYVPFTEPEQLERYRNTVFYSDEDRSMTFASASIKDKDGVPTLVLSFVLGWKVKNFTAQQAFEDITVDGHPFGQEKVAAENKSGN